MKKIIPTEMGNRGAGVTLIHLKCCGCKHTVSSSSTVDYFVLLELI